MTTAGRINIKSQYEGCDPFEEITDRVEIAGWNRWPDEVHMSHWGATHVDDFEGDIHLDLTEP